MSDEKITTVPETDPLSPRIDDVEAKAAIQTTAAPEVKPSFESDAFLAGKTAAKTAKSKTTRDEPKPAPQVVKRGGVGFMTALLMSCLATAGGAYMALFIQARPDVLQQAGLGAILPKPTAPPIATATATDLEPLNRRVAALEAQLASVTAKIEGGTAPTLPPSTTPPTTGIVPSDAPSNPTTSTNQVGPSALPASSPLPSAAFADLGTLKSELAGIGGRVTSIETRLAALDPTGAGGAVVAGLQSDIASLKAIISGLQQQVAAAPSPAVTFAVVNLAEAANRSAPFFTEYETLRAAMPTAPEVGALEGFARTGVPTRAALQERFAALGDAMTAAAEEGNKEGGLVIWIRALFSDMVKIKPATQTNGNGSDAIIARAKAKLDQGDLSACVDELAALPAPPAAVTQWTANAKRRLDLESRISAVRGAVGRTAPSAGQTAAVPTLISPAPKAVAPVPPTQNATSPEPALKTQGTNP